MQLNQTIKIGNEEVNIAARASDTGYRITIAPDDSADKTFRQGLLANAKAWCDATLGVIRGASAHAHPEEGQVIISVFGPSSQREMIETQIGRLPEALRNTNNAAAAEAYAGSST